MKDIWYLQLYIKAHLQYFGITPTIICVCLWWCLWWWGKQLLLLLIFGLFISNQDSLLSFLEIQTLVAYFLLLIKKIVCITLFCTTTQWNIDILARFKVRHVSKTHILSKKLYHIFMYHYNTYMYLHSSENALFLL